MNLWKVFDARRSSDLELDLRDVMLDLDPGMLAWTPPPTR